MKESVVVGTEESGGEVLRTELARECEELASDDVARRVSGYSFSKRSIMPWRVLSRKRRRPNRVSCDHDGVYAEVLTVVHVIAAFRLSNKCRLNPCPCIASSVK